MSRHRRDVASGAGMLELVGVAKRYGDVVALDDCSFTVEPGRVTGFLGPNGAGKTTAMRSVLGLVRPDAGEVRWNGVAVGADERRAFGYMPEERGVYPKMRVGEQVAYFGQLAGLSAPVARQRAAQWLERLGLADRGDDRVEALSHGNQQRVQLAIALVHDPQVLVLDEPLSGLDPIAVQAMMALLVEQAEAGRAVLFSSHQLDLVEDLCEDVVILYEGRVVLAGPLEELRSASGQRFVDLALAGDTAGFDELDGVEVEHRHNGRVRLRLAPGTDPLGVFERARTVGELTAMSCQPPTLSELFREVAHR